MLLKSWAVIIKKLNKVPDMTKEIFAINAILFIIITTGFFTCRYPSNILPVFTTN